MNQLGYKLAGAVALLLAAFASPVMAAETAGSGRNFNHMTTGFPLSGVHAVAPCETCHIGGVFKGTPKDCEGCHALGKRVVATPKSNNHIVTNAPCETCHFNTSTWLGARYNHGSARPGNCQSCHNGRMAAGKPGSHNAGRKATDSCDKCHRTMAWLPASWNHNGAVGSCDSAGCHVAGSNIWYKNMSTQHTRTGMATYACNNCHNYFYWSPAPYNHSAAGGRCDSCHNGTVAMGPNQYGTHPAQIGTNDCSQCHINTTHAWRPALGALPANHIPFNAGTSCTTCHTSVTTVQRGSALHLPGLSGMACTTCHLKNVSYRWGVISSPPQQKSYGHEGWNTGDCSQSGCHRPAGNRGSAYNTWD